MGVQSSQRKALYLALGLTILACLGVWLPAPFAVRLISAMLLAFFLTGWWLLQVVRLSADDGLEQIVLASGTSYGLTVLASLGILYTADGLSAQFVAGVLTLMH